MLYVVISVQHVHDQRTQALEIDSVTESYHGSHRMEHGSWSHNLSMMEYTHTREIRIAYYYGVPVPNINMYARANASARPRPSRPSWRVETGARARALGYIERAALLFVNV